MYMVISIAKEFAEEDGVDVDGYENFMETYYEDQDFLFLFDLSFDGIDKSIAGEMLGMGSLDVKDWFDPFNSPRTPHPFFWQNNERLEFPGNKNVPIDEELDEEFMDENQNEQSEDIDLPF